jgi:hypothetical protein
MIKNPSGRMVPRNPNMMLPNSGQVQARPKRDAPNTTKFNLTDNKAVNTNREIVQKNIVSYPIATYMSALVVKKRNIYLESQNYGDLEANDIYEIVGLYNNPKNGLIEYLNYMPVSSSTWRPVTKYLKKIQYNVRYRIEECETLENCDL